MSKQRNALKAGSFIIVSVLLIISVIVGIKGIQHFFEPVQQHQVRFKLTDDIGGLAAGDPVRIGGATVGTVRDITLDVDGDNPGIVITFAIPQKFKVRDNAVLNVQSTITGVSVLNFVSMGTGSELAAGQVLAGKPYASFSSLASAASDFVSDLRTTTLPKVHSAIDTYKDTGTHATDLIASVRGHVDPVIDRYNKVADKGTFALNEIGTWFGDTHADFRTTLSNVSSATGTIKERLPDLMDKVSGALSKISKAIDDTNSTLEDIKQVAANTRDATSSARSILVTNRSKIDHMIDSLKTTGDNLKFASSEIRRSPWRLLYKPSADEMANLNLYDSARQFAEGANSMSDAAQALRDALKDPKTNEKQIEALVDQLNKSFENFTQVESTLWQKVK